MREDVGGGKKKSQGKHGAAKALYVKPGVKAGAPDNWEDNRGSKSGSENPIDNNEIIAADVAVGPGGKMDDPNWLENSDATAMHTLEATLSAKQKKEILGRQKLVQELLSLYNIDSTTAQEWEDEGIRLQDVLRWCRLNFSLDQAKQWLKYQFSVDAVTKWHFAGVNVDAAIIFRRHQVPRDEAMAWVFTGLPLDSITYIFRFQVPFEQAEPWLMNKYLATEIIEFIKSGLPREHAAAIMELGLSPTEAKNYFAVFPDSTAWAWAKADITLENAREWSKFGWTQWTVEPGLRLTLPLSKRKRGHPKDWTASKQCICLMLVGFLRCILSGVLSFLFCTIERASGKTLDTWPL
ncbi:hypothetical protein DSO57_1029425 [Entomophthora muscae]|uniref:Uncharacterized protein n=1 Tax=Entomophthora muscae TaxID=34485 RepID=A0ACC2UBJ3_9FUNG|nr:hypothetical protein DSO57_1029425 [Entomophthora muscae]